MSVAGISNDFKIWLQADHATSVSNMIIFCETVDALNNYRKS